MSSIIIKVENLGKKYIIGHQSRGKYRTLREQMVHGLANVFSKTKRLVTGMQVLEGDELEDFWALRNIDLEIRQGDRVGIIGNNGAGKSTLLKILSRITEPTTGRISIKGRISSLLEVGTGFHQELTGRENVFLNGAILGMGRNEIKKKFDEIISFSGVEKFLDTPVKRYSSGMYVRLAFAIAAHLEPEILIVDEVLAVGDTEFQEKCIGKMNEVGRSGRTILFVSHQKGLIAQLCNRAILLEKGELKIQGNVEEVISRYNDRSTSQTFYSAKLRGKDIFFEKIEIINKLGELSSHFNHDESIFIRMRVHCKISGQAVQTTVALLDNLQRRLFTLHIPLAQFKRNENIYEATIKLKEGLITPQNYNFLFDLFTPHQAVFDNVSGIFPIKITDNGSQYAGYEGGEYGFYFIQYQIIE
jgi:homopolymeric O-antigen transport system ATP-binding protein